MEVVFHAGLDFYRDNKKEAWAKIIGQITTPLTMKALGKGRTLGVWFLPHAFSIFCNLPLHDLNDRTVSLENVFSQWFIQFVGDNLAEGKTEILIAGVNTYLIKKLSQHYFSHKEKIIAYAVERILKRDANLDNIVNVCNISRRHLEKIFLEKVGVSPKFLMRIVRFQQVVHELSDPTYNSLTCLGYEAGYYDQAHFIRDFRKLTGMLPSRFKPASHPINRYFLKM